MDDESRPRGGVTPKKYAAVCLALGVARGALHGALEGADVEEIRYFLDVTSTASIARALGCSESDLPVAWDEFLSPQEINRIKGWGNRDSPSGGPAESS
jgi:hypothetical protein